MQPSYLYGLGFAPVKRPVPHEFRVSCSESRVLSDAKHETRDAKQGLSVGSVGRRGTRLVGHAF